jgi:hypothetical protein
MGTDDACENIEALISQAVEVWKNGQTVNLSPIWKQHPQGHYLAKVLAERPDCEARLGEFLTHENELVVAYSLVALEMMDSRLLARLPKDLLERKQLFTSVRGSFGIEVELGEFANEIQKKWCAKRDQK